jgi:plasmid stability protein
MRESSKLAGKTALFVELPKELKAALKVRAAASQRTMSGQVRAMLLEALAAPADQDGGAGK